MLRTPTTRSGMPFFSHVEREARNLRPLQGHRLAASPLLSPASSDEPNRAAQLVRRTSPLLGGVAVLAVAGALSSGLGATHQPAGELQAAPAVTIAAPAVPAAPAAPGLDTLLRPVSYTVPMTAAAAAAPAVKPAIKTVAKPAVKAVAKPRGAAVVTHLDTVRVKAIKSSLRRLRSCESGGNYREASGNGYYGAYQFDVSTWHSLGLLGYPSNASHQLQDVAVMRLASSKGWGPWPVCSYVAGLR